jgi:lysophospholipase L1-like esterase
MRQLSSIFLVVLLVSGCSMIRKHSPVLSKPPAKHPIEAEGHGPVREPGSDLLWYDARYLTVEGKGWTDTGNFWERLPARAKGKVPKRVWALSKNTAGICVRFVTDSKEIHAIWDGGGAMNHMAATGNSGLDLYARKNGQWEFKGVGRPKQTRSNSLLAKNLSGKPTEYLLYLPLYNHVTELKIGIQPDSMIKKAPDRPREKAKPIVFYGTSITQGGCASRCGMCHAALLGRWLDREVINLGFSGSGKMEPELAKLLCELEPEMFILECLPNMTTAMVQERVEPFVRILRRSHPDTPILLVENPIGVPHNAGNAALRKIYEKLQNQNVKNLYYLPGDSQLAGEENGTVDGVHPTDLGFFRMAVAYRPVLEKIIAEHDHE